MASLWSTPFRVVSALQNAVEFARLGRARPATRTPYEVVLREATFRLRHYDANGAQRGKRPPILLVPPLMLTAEVYDIAAEGSAVAALRKNGVDPWVVDFGAPERQEGGLRRTLTDHILAVSRAVDRVREETGTDVHLAGYSQGGMFCYQTAAYRRSEGLASLITFGSPVDVSREILPGIPDELARVLLDLLGRFFTLVFSRSAVPAWLSRTVFKMLSPAKELRSQIEFLTRLQDREAAQRREGQRRFLASEGWVAWPGPALRDFVEQFLVQNRLFSGGFVVEGRTLTLADITCPVLAFVGETDEIARPAWVRSIREAAPRAEVYESRLRAGHFGLVVGSMAMQESWPTVARWVRWRAGVGRRPARVVPAGRAEKAPEQGGSAAAVSEFVWDLGRETVEAVGDLVGDGARVIEVLTRNVSQQLPRLARLAGVRRDTRIGLALSLAEQAAARPQGTFFLFAGRAYNYADANRRVDAIVRGLISVGVRQGAHVGVYMRTRPTALALVTAVNRLGAVAVLLRPDGDLGREIALGEVEHVICDPELAEKARAVLGQEVLVLGGGGTPRSLPAGLIDMEAIDPDQVAVPDWYVPSPGRAEEVAFILFAGGGERTRANRITNRRWALSAFGAASAAAMTTNDTVYCWTRIQHPTGLLVSIGSALVGGARLALAGELSATAFWPEVRRYGASVVFYAGTMCRALVDAPPDPAERSHPVRLFAGSGMPAPLWRRVVDRFGPVGVLEFYATTEGNAILANVEGDKIGCVGRPLPGSAEVAIAEFDVQEEAIVHDGSGYCRRVGDDAAGMLLARVDRDRGALEGRPLRSVFESADAWYPTNDLFRCDADGDYWLIDHVRDLIRHRDGALPSLPIEECVWSLPGVSIAAAYGLRLDGLRFEIPAVAVVLRTGATLDRAGLLEQVERDLPAESRPLVVRVVDALPMTAGYRVRKEALAALPLDEVTRGEARTYWYDAVRREYRQLDAGGLSQLAAQAARQRRPARKRTAARRQGKRGS